MPSPAGGPRTGVDALLERIGLLDVAERGAATLAYGLQRRVEIARALAGEPRFLLLDEPAAGMNETESDDLLATIRAVRDERELGVLLVDHDLRLIMRLCERIHVLAEGRTICEGSPQDVRKTTESSRHTSARRRQTPARPTTTDHERLGRRIHARQAQADGCRGERSPIALLDRRAAPAAATPAGADGRDRAHDRVLGRAERSATPRTTHRS